MKKLRRYERFAQDTRTPKQTPVNAIPMESQISRVKAAIIAEFARQTPGVYFWDGADEELFDGGPIEMSDFQDSEGGIFQLADKFDMDAIAAAAISVMETE